MSSNCAFPPSDRLEPDSSVDRGANTSKEAHTPATKSSDLQSVDEETGGKHEKELGHQKANVTEDGSGGERHDERSQRADADDDSEIITTKNDKGKGKALAHDQTPPTTTKDGSAAVESSDDEGMTGRHQNAGWRSHMAKLAHEKAQGTRERRAALKLEAESKAKSGTKSKGRAEAEVNTEASDKKRQRRSVGEAKSTVESPRQRILPSMSALESSNRLEEFMTMPRPTQKPMTGPTNTLPDIYSQLHSAANSSSLTHPQHETLMPPPPRPPTVNTISQAHPPSIPPNPPPRRILPNSHPQALAGFPLLSHYIATHPHPPHPEIFARIFDDSRRPYIASEDPSRSIPAPRTPSLPPPIPPVAVDARVRRNGRRRAVSTQRAELGPDKGDGAAQRPSMYLEYRPETGKFRPRPVTGMRVSRGGARGGSDGRPVRSEPAGAGAPGVAASGVDSRSARGYMPGTAVLHPVGSMMAAGERAGLGSGEGGRAGRGMNGDAWSGPAPRRRSSEGTPRFRVEGTGAEEPDQGYGVQGVGTSARLLQAQSQVPHGAVASMSAPPAVHLDSMYRSGPASQGPPLGAGTWVWVPDSNSAAVGPLVLASVPGWNSGNYTRVLPQPGHGQGYHTPQPGHAQAYHSPQPGHAQAHHTPQPGNAPAYHPPQPHHPAHTAPTTPSPHPSPRPIPPMHHPGAPTAPTPHAAVPVPSAPVAASQAAGQGNSASTAIVISSSLSDSE